MQDLIDIGANLTHDSFDTDRAEVIARARVAGVKRIIVTGASRAGSPQAALLADEFPGVLWATAGIHPHHATEYDAATDALLRTLAQRDNVVGSANAALITFAISRPLPSNDMPSMRS